MIPLSFSRGFFSLTAIWRSLFGGLHFGDGNSYSTSISALLWSNLVRGSVRRLTQERQTKPWYASGGSAHLKNIETNSSGEGTVYEGTFLFKLLEITVEGYHLFLARQLRGLSLGFCLQ